MNRFSKNLCTIMLCTAMAVALIMPADAINVPEIDKTGSVTIVMQNNNTAIEGGELSVYRVAEIDNTDENYTFAATGEFAGFTGNIHDTENPAEVLAMENYIKSNNIKGKSSVIGARGRTEFLNLKTGLYFVMQTVNTNGFLPAQSFFVSVPAKEGEVYVYDVNATPKTSIEKAPAPPPPGIPDTGVARWAVPVFAAVGLTFFARGWYIFRKGSQNG